MPGAGVEPARSFDPGGLSALRLPFRHPGAKGANPRRRRETEDRPDQRRQQPGHRRSASPTPLALHRWPTRCRRRHRRAHHLAAAPGPGRQWCGLHRRSAAPRVRHQVRAAETARRASACSADAPTAKDRSPSRRIRQTTHWPGGGIERRGATRAWKKCGRTPVTLSGCRRCALQPGPTRPDDELITLTRGHDGDAGTGAEVKSPTLRSTEPRLVRS